MDSPDKQYMDSDDRLEKTYLAINHIRSELFEILHETKKKNSPVHKYGYKLEAIYRDIVNTQRDMVYDHPQQLCEY